MTSERPHHRNTTQTPNMSATSRRQPPVLFYGLYQYSYLPPAPDPPTRPLQSFQVDCDCPVSSPGSSIREPYHVTSHTTPITTSTKPGSNHNRRSPSPIPPTPGAPKITPLSDSDMEDEDKELAGIDRGYLRLGGRRHRYLPSPPATPPPSEPADKSQDEDDNSLSSKMHDQLDFAMQYIRAQAQMGPITRPPRPVENQDRRDGGTYRSRRHDPQVYPHNTLSIRSYREGRDRRHHGQAQILPLKVPVVVADRRRDKKHLLL